MHSNDHLGTSFKDLLAMTNLSERQMLNHSCKFSGTMFYTTEQSVIEFLEYKTKTTPIPLSKLEATDGQRMPNGWIVVDMNSVASKIRRVEGEDVPAERHKRPKKKAV